MHKFAKERINAINGKLPFYQLVVDGEKALDKFENKLEKSYGSELRTLITYMEYFATNYGSKSLPPKKFKYLDGKKQSDLVKEFEFKSKHLRIYGIIKDGAIIMLGGYKNSQPEDIIKFRSLKKSYLNI